MATPFTEGKRGTNGSGGHTSMDPAIPKDCQAPATSNVNTRIGNLTTRTTGGLGESNTRRK